MKIIDYIKSNIKSRKYSFHFLMISLFFIMLILVNVVTIALYSNSYKQLSYDNLVQSQEVVSLNLIDLVNAKLESQAQIITSISNNESVMEIINDRPANLLTQISQENDLSKIFLDYSGSLKDIYSVNIFSKNYAEPLNSLMVGKYSEDVAPYAINDYTVFEKYILNDVLYKYSDEVLFNVFREESIATPILMSLKWIIGSSNEQVGVITILMPFEHAFSVISDLGKHSESTFFLIDTNGNPIYNTRKNDEFDLQEDSIALESFIAQGKISNSSTIEYEEKIVTISSFGTLDWLLVTSTPKSVVRSGYKQELNNAILFSGIVTLVLTIFAYLITKLMLRGMQDLLKNIKTVKKGNLEITYQSSKLKEIEELNKNFERMTSEIGTLMEKIDEVNKSEKEAELKALQAQINPHFLYNTLDALYWMSDDESVSNIISALGKFYRLSLSRGMDLVLARNEILQVENYIKIQMNIYPGRFDYSFKIDESVYDYMMMKLVLQPLVENAILHGFKNMRNSGFIHIRASLDDNFIKVSIEDNGKGFDPDSIDSILNGGKNAPGYGIRNVNERIKLKFGEAFGLSYTPRPGGGTIATLLMPKIKKTV